MGAIVHRELLTEISFKKSKLPPESHSLVDKGTV